MAFLSRSYGAPKFERSAFSAQGANLVQTAAAFVALMRHLGEETHTLKQHEILPHPTNFTRLTLTCKHVGPAKCRIPVWWARSRNLPERWKNMEELALVCLQLLPMFAHLEIDGISVLQCT